MATTSPENSSPPTEAPEKLPTTDVITGLGWLTAEYQEVIEYGREASVFLKLVRKHHNAALDEFAKLCILSEEAQAQYVGFFKQIETQPMPDNEPDNKETFYEALDQLFKEVNDIHDDQLIVRQSFRTARAELRPATHADKAAEKTYKEKNNEAATATEIRVAAEASYDEEERAHQADHKAALAARRQAIRDQGEMEEYFGRVNNQNTVQPVSDETTSQRTMATEDENRAKLEASTALQKLSAARTHLLEITDMFVESEENMQKYDEKVPDLMKRAEALLATHTLYVDQIQNLYETVATAIQAVNDFSFAAFFQRALRQDTSELHNNRAMPQLESLRRRVARKETVDTSVQLQKTNQARTPQEMPQVSVEHDEWEVADLEELQGTKA